MSNSEEPTLGNIAATIDLGAGHHLGVSVNVATGADRPQVLGGGALHIGYAVGSFPVTAGVPLPESKLPRSAYSCAKLGIGCE